MTGFAKGKISEAVQALDVVVVSKPAGGYDEFWKNWRCRCRHLTGERKSPLARARRERRAEGAKRTGPLFADAPRSRTPDAVSAAAKAT